MFSLSLPYGTAVSVAATCFYRNFPREMEDVQPAWLPSSQPAPAAPIGETAAKSRINGCPADIDALSKQKNFSAVA